MMASRLLLALVFLTVSLSAQAQLYKWVAPDGTVTYSDTPPPKTATKVETKSFNAGGDNSNAALPFELARAVKAMPVTLYTGADCAPCNDGRAFLKQSGIPFYEKTVSTFEDAQKLKKISPGNNLPILLIGSNTTLKGFVAGDWRSNLSQAGYPETNLLPADYRYPAPQPAAPPPPKPAKSNEAAPPQPEKPARDPNGFQF
ncbi:glutaredoxin family protein [Sapientia aquatica]|nr:glutaredoxin family protein [Sapientia aquatica]